MVLKALGQETFFDAKRSVMISWGSRSGGVYSCSLLAEVLQHDHPKDQSGAVSGAAEGTTAS